MTDTLTIVLNYNLKVINFDTKRISAITNSKEKNLTQESIHTFLYLS